MRGEAAPEGELRGAPGGPGHVQGQTRKPPKNLCTTPGSGSIHVRVIYNAPRFQRREAPADVIGAAVMGSEGLPRGKRRGLPGPERSYFGFGHNVQCANEGRKNWKIRVTVILCRRLAVIERSAAQNSDHRPRRLLRARQQRPRKRRAAEQRDERASSHSITSSARASSMGGTVRPSILAVLRLSTNSNLVGCITGNSAGLAPLRTRPVRTPTCR
jgi:hypothetical protein